MEESYVTIGLAHIYNFSGPIWDNIRDELYTINWFEKLRVIIIAEQSAQVKNQTQRQTETHEK